MREFVLLLASRAASKQTPSELTQNTLDASVGGVTSLDFALEASLPLGAQVNGCCVAIALQRKRHRVTFTSTEPCVVTSDAAPIDLHSDTTHAHST